MRNRSSTRENMDTYECGICSNRVDVVTILTHACFKGFNRVFVDDHTVVWPTMDSKSIDGSIARGVISNPMPIDCSEMQPKNSAVISPVTSADTVEEDLILAVQMREPLWNHKLPITERGRNVVRELWEEVVISMNGKVKDVDEAKKIWKNLRYNYTRVLDREQAAKRSGAAGKGKGVEAKWSYYHQMSFTRDILINSRQTSSNLDEASTSTSPEVCDDSSVSSRAPKRFAPNRRGSDIIEESLSRLTRALEKPLPAVPQLIVPELPPAPLVETQDLDEVGHILGLVKAALKRMEIEDRESFMLELLTFIVTKERSIRNRNK